MGAGRVRLVGIALGVAITIFVALAALLLAFVSLALDPFLISVTSTGTVNGVTSTTVTGERARGLFLLVAVISAVFIALFAGGFVAGRLAPPHAGFNGAVMGVLLVSVLLLWLVGSLASVLLEPTMSPDEVFTRSESVRMLGVALVVYSAVSPVFVLASFLGGRTGGRAGRRSAGTELQSG